MTPSETSDRRKEWYRELIETARRTYRRYVSVTDETTGGRDSGEGNRSGPE